MKLPRLWFHIDHTAAFLVFSSKEVAHCNFFKFLSGYKTLSNGPNEWFILITWVLEREFNQRHVWENL